MVFRKCVVYSGPPIFVSICFNFFDNSNIPLFLY
ncbi:hypothetical protein KSS87_017018, partial [Heliosperma pusillum]